MNTHIYVMQIIIGSNEWIWTTNQIQIYKNFVVVEFCTAMNPKVRRKCNQNKGKEEKKKKIQLIVKFQYFRRCFIEKRILMSFFLQSIKKNSVRSQEINMYSMYMSIYK